MKIEPRNAGSIEINLIAFVPKIHANYSQKSQSKVQEVILIESADLN
jgi:hypothetical protein